jgi:hypothetical protein
MHTDPPARWLAEERVREKEKEKKKERDARKSRRTNEREGDGRSERHYFSPERGISLCYDVPRGRPLILLIRGTV